MYDKLIKKVQLKKKTNKTTPELLKSFFRRMRLSLLMTFTWDGLGALSMMSTWEKIPLQWLWLQDYNNLFQHELKPCCVLQHYKYLGWNMQDNVETFREDGKVHFF